MKYSRREAVTAIGSAAALSSLLSAAESLGSDPPLIATNTYPWSTFARRDQKPFEMHTDQFLSDIASTGINGYEPIIKGPAEFAGLSEGLSKHGLTMHSIYVNSSLHDRASVQKSIDSVLEIADAAAKLGVKIIVTNPSPIRWGGDEDKSDSQLRLQSKSLNLLGAELRERGQVLAYHNHDAELRRGGREFHHMLTATDPANVKFCLDAHWIFRGCGDSEVAVFDALTLYHERVVELHLRQSTGGVWTEAFAMSGDVNYSRMFDFLAKQKITPHLVLEQAIEGNSSKELSAIDAHRKSFANLNKVIG